MRLSENSNKSDKTKNGRKKKKITKDDLLREAKRKESLTFEDLRNVFEACETIEEEALIKVAVTTGIRRADIAKIELINVNLDEREIIFWEEKKDRFYKVPIEPHVVKVLKQYIGTLAVNERYLFPFSDRTAYRRFNEVLKRAGLPPMRFHDLRRSCMRLSRQMGRDMRYVMDLTGDTAETILNEYEGYSIDEMNKMLDDTSITYMALSNGDLKAKKKLLEDELERIDQILKKREGVLY